MFDNMTFTEVLSILEAYKELGMTLGFRYDAQFLAEAIDENSGVQITLASWSDYAYNEFGSEYDRANVMYWEGFGIHTEQRMGSGRAWIEIGDTLGANSPRELVNILMDIERVIRYTLYDSPCIDDDIFYNMQQVDADNAWQDYIYADICYELAALNNPKLGDSVTAVESWLSKNEEEFRTHYYEFENLWTYETPTNIVNPNHAAARDYALTRCLTK